MYKIAVLDYRIPSDIQDKIQALASNKIDFPENLCAESEVISRVKDAEIVLITPWDKVDSNFLNACPNIKYIGLCGTSTANIDLDELKLRNIAFSNVVSKDKHANHAVAEFFFMQLVSLARGIGEYQWKTGQEHELAGRNIGIIGLGKVGQAFAHMALAYKMNVCYFSPNRMQEWEDKGLAYKSRSDLLESSEIVVLCSPTNIEVMGASEFELLKQGSILVQACGGSPFDKPSFMNWIANDGNYAIFDMSANAKNFELYKNIPRIIFSKKVAGDTYESNQRRGNKILQNLNDYINLA